MPEKSILSFGSEFFCTQPCLFHPYFPKHYLAIPEYTEPYRNDDADYISCPRDIAYDEEEIREEFHKNKYVLLEYRSSFWFASKFVVLKKLVIYCSIYE